MNPSSADLVMLLDLVSNGSPMARGGFMEDIGGVCIMCIVADQHSVFHARAERIH